VITARTTVLPFLIVVAAALVVAACWQGDRSGPPERIILILVDTLRRDHLSPYGGEASTPNVQRLADRGRVFTNLVASYHQTTMSMGALFTGRTPSIESGDVATTLEWTGRSWCGLRRFAEGSEDSCLPQGLTTLAERLRGVGYTTIGVTSNRLLFRPAGFEQGFDRWLEVGADSSSLPEDQLVELRSAPHVLAATRKATETLPDGPMFLYVHYVDVHDWGATDREYAEAVEIFDVALGDLLSLLEERGLLEDAVVIFTADHGEALGEMHAFGKKKGHYGNPSYQSVLEIPLIVAPAPEWDATRMLRSQDLPDLIAGLAGAPPQATSSLGEDELFLGERFFLTYRKGRWKSLFHRRKMKRWALFDLEADPGETENLISEHTELSLSHFERVQDLSKELVPATISQDEMTEEDRARLRALGYLE
jgi:arylsulfatase A-like enzyme